MRLPFFALLIAACSTPPPPAETFDDVPLPPPAAAAERRVAALRFHPSAEEMRTVVQAMAPAGLTVGGVTDQGDRFVLHGRGPTMDSVVALQRALNRLLRTSRRELAWETDRFQSATGVRAVLQGADGPLGDRDFWSIVWFTSELSATEEVAGGATTFDLQLGPLQ